MLGNLFRELVISQNVGNVRDYLSKSQLICFVRTVWVLLDLIGRFLLNVDKSWLVHGCTWRFSSRVPPTSNQHIKYHRDINKLFKTISQSKQLIAFACGCRGNLDDWIMWSILKTSTIWLCRFAKLCPVSPSYFLFLPGHNLKNNSTNVSCLTNEELVPNNDSTSESATFWR